MTLLTPIRICRYVTVFFIFITCIITLVIYTGSSKKEIVSIKELAKEVTLANRITESKFLEKKADGDNSVDENHINSLQNQDNKNKYVSFQVQSDVLKFTNFTKNSCKKNINSGIIKKSSLNSWEFLINHEFKLVYCPIFKSASSTWIFNFLKMKRVKLHDLNVVKNGPNHYVRDYYPRPSQKYLQSVLNENYTSLLIIRDPFERLLSAYKDKVESTSNDYFNPFICNISKGKKDALGNCRATFSDFVDFLIFEQEKGRKPNEHWATYDEFCSPCQVHFDYVLKFEHLDLQEPYFISQIPGLTSVLKENTILHSSKANYEFILSAYFSQLSRKQFERLLKIYKKDFEVFGYNYQKYRNMLL